MTVTVNATAFRGYFLKTQGQRTSRLAGRFGSRRLGRRRGRTRCGSSRTIAPFVIVIGPGQSSGSARHATGASPLPLEVMVPGTLAVNAPGPALHALAPMAFTFTSLALAVVGARLATLFAHDKEKGRAVEREERDGINELHGCVDADWWWIRMRMQCRELYRSR